MHTQSLISHLIFIAISSHFRGIYMRFVSLISGFRVIRNDRYYRSLYGIFSDLSREIWYMSSPAIILSVLALTLEMICLVLCYCFGTIHVFLISVFQVSLLYRSISNQFSSELFRSLVNLQVMLIDWQDCVVYAQNYFDSVH